MAKSFPNTGATVIDSVSDLPAASTALEGVMMFQKDTNELKICDGSSWISVVDTDTPNGMVLVKSQTLSAVNSALVQSCFSSLFLNYRIVLSATGSGFFSIGLQLASGATPVGGTTYNTTSMYIDGTTGPSRSTTTSTDRFVVGNSSAGMCIYTIDITSPFETTKTGALSVGSGSAQYLVLGSGEMTTASSYDGFNLLSNTAGTFTGTVRVYGYRNSI